MPCSIALYIAVHHAVFKAVQPHTIQCIASNIPYIAVQHNAVNTSQYHTVQKCKSIQCSLILKSGGRGAGGDGSIFYGFKTKPFKIKK